MVETLLLCLQHPACPTVYDPVPIAITEYGSGKLSSSSYRISIFASFLLLSVLLPSQPSLDSSLSPRRMVVLSTMVRSSSLRPRCAAVAARWGSSRRCGPTGGSVLPSRMPEASPVSLPRVHPFARERTGHSTHTTFHTCPTSALLAHCPGERGMETTTTRRPAESRRRERFSCLSKSHTHRQFWSH